MTQGEKGLFEYKMTKQHAEERVTGNQYNGLSKAAGNTD